MKRIKFAITTSSILVAALLIVSVLIPTFVIVNKDRIFNITIDHSFGFFLNPIYLDRSGVVKLNNIIGRNTEDIIFNIETTESGLINDILQFINKEENTDYMMEDVYWFNDVEDKKWYFKTIDDAVYLIVDGFTCELILFVTGEYLYKNG